MSTNFNTFISTGHQKIKNIFLISEQLEAREFTRIQQKIRLICINARKIYDKLEEKPALMGEIEKTLAVYMEKSEKTVHMLLKSLNVYLAQKESGNISQKEELLNKAEILVGNLEKSLEKLLTRLFSEEIIDLQAEIKLLDNMIMADGLFEIE